MINKPLHWLALGALLFLAGCPSDKKTSDVSRTRSEKKHAGDEGEEGEKGELPPCSAANLFGLVSLNPIKADLLQVKAPKVSQIQYPSGQKVMVIDMEPMDSTKNPDYSSDYAKIRVCVVDPDAGCDCIVEESGTWYEEISLPACMSGDVTVEVAGCVTPERRKGDAECGKYKKVIDSFQVVNPDSPEFEILQKMRDNERKRYQLALDLKGPAQKLMSYVEDKKYIWPDDPAEKQKIETYVTFAKNVVVNPHLLAATFSTYLLDDAVAEVQQAQDEANQPAGSGADEDPSAGPVASLALAEEAEAAEQANCKVLSTPGDAGGGKTAGTKSGVSDKSTAAKANTASTNTNTGPKTGTPPPVVQTRNTDPTSDPNTDPNTGPDIDPPSGSNSSTGTGGGEVGALQKGFGTALVVAGAALLAWEVGKAGLKYFGVIKNKTKMTPETGLDVKGRPSVLDGAEIQSIRPNRTMGGKLEYEVKYKATADGPSVKKTFPPDDFKFTGTTAGQTKFDSGTLGDKNVLKNVKSKGWGRVKGVTKVGAAIAMMVFGGYLMEHLLLANSPLQTFKAEVDKATEKLNKLKFEYEDLRGQQNALEDAAGG